MIPPESRSAVAVVSRTGLPRERRPRRPPTSSDRPTPIRSRWTEPSSADFDDADFDRAVDAVAFMTHHLYESVFLGDEARAASKLDQASALAVQIESEKTRHYLEDEVRELRELLTAWDAYRQGDRQVGFVQWCEAQGHAFGFSQAYYYTP